MEGRISQTVAKSEFSPIIQNDTKLWENKYFKMKP